MKRKNHFKIGENEKEIIKSIGLGTLVIASFVLPGLPVALKPFLKARGPSKFTKFLKNLSDKNIIYLGGDKIRLTKKGTQYLNIINTQEIVITKPKQWDGLWHLVSYDIPDTSKKKRDWFRKILQGWGFRKIQESLWVFPYECKEEVAVVAQNLGIARFVIVMNTNQLPNQQKMESYFQLVDKED